jgi:alanine racemase
MTRFQNHKSWEALGPTWIEVDLDVLAANLAAITTYVRRKPPPEAADFMARHGLRPSVRAPKVMVIVKGNAYGHGAVEVARAAIAAGADALGVSTLVEALELRQAGISGPLLMISPLTADEAPSAARAGITTTLSSLEAAERLAAEACRLGLPGGLPAHVAVETGMSRFGVSAEALVGFSRAIAALPGLRLEGLYTHFSAGSDQGAASLVRMRRQLDRFGRAVAAVEAAGIEVPLRHAACSSAVLRLPESYLDLVRVGNLFYGFGGPRASGSREGARVISLSAAVAPPRVREAWSLYTRVLEVRDVAAGTGVGYGPDVIVTQATRLATVPIGYVDGAGLLLTKTTLRLGVRLKPLGRQLALWVYRALDGPAWGRGPSVAGPPLGRVRALLDRAMARLAALAREAAIFLHEGRPVDIVGRISMHETILRVTGRPEIGVGTVLRVRVSRVLSSPRLGRVYFSGGRVAAVRTPSGLAEAATAWDGEAGDGIVAASERDQLKDCPLAGTNP